MDGGKRVRCNICGEVNPVDERHYSPLGTDGYPINIQDRVELMNGCYEIKVGEEFTNKTPAYPSYLFVVDVSYASIKNGIAQSAFSAIQAAIKDSLLSGQKQSSFGIVCIDTKLHLIKFGSASSKIQVVTMSGNFETCPIPPSQLLVSLEDLADEAVIDQISTLHEAFSARPDNRSSIPVKSIILLSNMYLSADLSIMKTNGGKVSIILANDIEDWGASLNVDSAINSRNLHLPSNTFYTQSGNILSVNQIGMDFFIFSNDIYHNLATLTDLNRTLCGDIHYYQNSTPTETFRFYNDFWSAITRVYSWETGLRVRISEEWSKREYGNFFFKVKDLMSLGPVDEYSSLSPENTRS